MAPLSPHLRRRWEPRQLLPTPTTTTPPIATTASTSSSPQPTRCHTTSYTTTPTATNSPIPTPTTRRPPGPITRTIRPTGITYTDGTHSVTYTYTPDGKVATMTDASGTTTYTYDNDDRLAVTRTGRGQPSATPTTETGMLPHRLSQRENRHRDLQQDQPPGVADRLEQQHHQFSTIATATSPPRPTQTGLSILGPITILTRSLA